MKIWILQTGEPLQIDSAGLRPMRAMNLSKALNERGHEVVLWSSDFDHFSKKHRYGKESCIKISELLEIRLIKSRGYKSHFGIGRLIDHAQLGWNLYRMLNGQDRPDVAFIGYPPIEPAWVMARWLKKNVVPAVLDIKDAWPEILLRAFPAIIRPIIKLILTPYFLAMKSTFNSVTALSSVTESFLSWSINVSGRESNSKNIVNYLTTENIPLGQNEILEAVRFFERQGISQNGQLRGAFIGTLNSAFDFDPILFAAKTLPIQIVIAGSGPFYNRLLDSAKDLPNIKFVGWITSTQARVLMTLSTFVLAPYKDLSDFDIHIPNKFFDAMCHGVPIVTSITGIAKQLVNDSNIGLTYSPRTIDSLSEALLPVIKNPQIFSEMSKNAKKLYEERYAFEKVYGDCVTNLESLVERRK